MNIKDDTEFCLELKAFVLSGYTPREDPALAIKYMRNQWLHGEHLQVYMRNCFMYLPNRGAAPDDVGTREFVTVIANVEISREHRRQGLYSSLLDEVEYLVALDKRAIVIIENVLDVEQYPAYMRRGYLPIGGEYSLIQPACSFRKSLTNHQS